jgi:hypothetical protein
MSTMKWLYIAVLLAVVQASVPVPRKTADGPARASNHVDKAAQAAQTPTPAAMAPVDPIQADPAQDTRQNPDPKDAGKTVVIGKLPTVSVGRDWADWVLWIFSGLLAIAGLCGIGFAYKTLKLIERQTKAGEDAAKAAFLNAEAVVLSQRPWLFIPMGDEFSEIGDPLLPDTGDKRFCQVKFELKNFGHTPARIIEQQIHLYVGKSPETVPDPMAFEPLIPVIEDYTLPQGTRVPVQATLQPKLDLDPQDRKGLLVRARFLWLCGYIKYREASDSPMRPLAYETRICYLWITNTDRPKTFWVMRGPREYNKAT